MALTASTAAQSMNLSPVLIDPDEEDDNLLTQAGMENYWESEEFARTLEIVERRCYIVVAQFNEALRRQGRPREAARMIQTVAESAAPADQKASCGVELLPVCIPYR